MHELSITRSVVAIVTEQAAGQRVKRVRLEVGCLSSVMPDALRFCFDVCARGTPVEGAELEIIEIPGRGQCDACSEETPLAVPAGRCPVCGTGRLRPTAGHELNIKEMEVESCA